MGAGYEHHFGLRERAFEPGEGTFAAQLQPEEIEPYLVERLRDAGWEGQPMLDLGLAALLHEATGGEREAVDRAMSSLLDEAAEAGRTIIQGDGLAAWLDRDPQSDAAAPPVEGLVEAQIGAIEVAFADHDRKLSRLRRELADLRSGPGGTAVPGHVEVRLETLETRLEQQEAALRHVLEQLIAFFEEKRG